MDDPVNESNGGAKNSNVIIPETIQTVKQSISKTTIETSNSSISTINSEAEITTNSDEVVSATNHDESSNEGTHCDDIHDENHTILSFGSGLLCHTSFSSTKPSELFHLIESLNWENVLSHLESNPREAQIWEKLRVKHNTKTERLPIHHACLKLRMEVHDKRLAIRVIEKILDLYPECCRMRESRHGCLPLHLLAYASSCRLKCTRKESTGKSLMVGLLPQNEIEEELVNLVKKMMKIYPRAVKIDSEGGRLPLHMSLSGRACPRVFQVLLNAYPSAARHRTRDMNLPLHLTATWGISSPDVPIALLQAYPDAALGQNRYGRTPLEEAIFIAGDVGRENQMDLLRVIRKHPTFWLSPQGRNVKNFQHFLQVIQTDTIVPELYELIKCQNWDGVLDRLDQYSEEAQFYVPITSRSGRSIRYTPLHYACELDPPLHVIQTLVALYPPSLAKRSMPGGFLPLHLAATFSSPSTISYIFEKLPKATSLKDELGNLPIHLLCYSPYSTNEIIHQLVSFNPTCIFVTNKAGSTPLDIVSRLFKEKGDVIACLKKFIFQGSSDEEDEDSGANKELVWI